MPNPSTYKNKRPVTVGRFGKIYERNWTEKGTGGFLPNIFIKLDQFKEQNNYIIMLLRSKGFTHVDDEVEDILDKACITREEVGRIVIEDGGR